MAKKIPERIKKFYENAHTERHYINKELMNVGLSWGWGKIMKEKGFSRNEQIKILDWLERNSWAFKELDKKFMSENKIKEVL